MRDDDVIEKGFREATRDLQEAPIRWARVRRRVRRRRVVAVATVILTGLGLTAALSGIFLAGKRAVDPDFKPFAGQQIDFTLGTSSVAVGPKTVWLTNRETGDISRLDTRGRLVGVSAGSCDEPASIAADAEAAWVTCAADNTLLRVDSATGRPLGPPIAVGGRPSAIAVGGGLVWVANQADNTVMRVDPRTGEVVGATAVGDQPSAIAVRGGLVWVANEGDDTVTRVDARTGRTLGPPRAVGSQPSAIAPTEDGVWVALGGGDSVVRLDTDSSTPRARIRVGGRPRGVALYAGSVWATSEADDTVSRIDPQTNRLIARIRVGKSPQSIAAGAGGIWVTSRDGNVSRLSPSRSSPPGG